MSRSTGRGGDAYKAKEYDDTRRRAEVYLFTRPVDDKLPNSIEYHHWALVFEFDGEDVRTAEGFPDDKKKLYPKYTKLFPAESGKYYTLCKFVTSPATVLEKTKENKHNDTTYIATWQNCQTWAKELAYSLGGELADKIDDYDTLKEANPVVAAAGKKKKVFSS